MHPVIVLVLLTLTGCATSLPSTRNSAAPTSATQPNWTADRAATTHITRYELGTYRYPVAADGRDETAVLRMTRVPVHAIGQPTNDNISSAYDPLPPSAELAAELSAQRDITEQLRTMKSEIVAARKKADEQYGALVSHTEDVVKLRQQLKTERARVRELETKLQGRLQAVPVPAGVSNSGPTSTQTEGAKW